ncbi:MAG: hypothetical protein WHS82_07790 [Candidatus Methanosuratincola sp.]
MDQAFEAAIAFAIFVAAFSASQYTAAAIYASSMSGLSEPRLEAAACIVASEILLQNGNSSEGWSLWDPVYEAGYYFSPATGVRLAIRATCYSLDPSGEVTRLWIKEGPAPESLSGSVQEYVGGVLLEDGTFVRLEVYASNGLGGGGDLWQFSG